MSEHKPTIEGANLIKDWLNAQQSVERCKQHLNSAECEVMNTANALSKWMLPDDAKPGEKIAVWFGDSLIQFERLVDIAFEAGKITRETYDKGMIVALEMEQAHRSRKGTPAVLDHAARVNREQFAALFDRDTAPRGDAP